MKRIDIIRRAGQGIKQAKLRTILTSLAISVGAFTIALAMAAGNGGRAYLDDQVASAGDARSIRVSKPFDVGAAPTDKPVRIGDVAIEPVQPALTNGEIESMKRINGVESVFPVGYVEAYSFSRPGGDQYEGVTRVQYDGTKIELTAGSLGDNYAVPEGQVVLPHTYVSAFGFSSPEDAVGKKIAIAFRASNDIGSSGAGAVPATFTEEFTVAAVDAQPSSSLAFYNKEFVLSNADGNRIAQKQTPAGQEQKFYSVMVIARQASQVDTVKQAIVSSGTFEAQTFAEFRSSVAETVSIAQNALIGFGILALIASVFGIINTQYISVLERTQQIGLMKALGMPKSGIAKLFRYEAAWVGFLGGLIGVGLAFIVTLFSPLITSMLNLEPGTRLLQLDVLSSSVIIISLMIVAVASGYFPARKAAKLDPIEALKTE